MSHLKCLLMTSVQEDLKFTQYFPLNSDDEKNIYNELLIISKYLTKCGNGSLQHKNTIYFYRTYIHSNFEKNENYNDDNNFYNENKTNKNNQKIFIIFFCSLKYNQKHIDNFTTEIFNIFDKNGFNGEKLNDASLSKINTLFKKYQKLSPEFKQLNPMKKYNSYEIVKTEEKSNDILIDKTSINRRFNSRIIVSKTEYKDSFNPINFDDEFNSFKANERDLSIMFKQNEVEGCYIPQINQWKKIKVIDIIINIIIFIIFLILIICFFSFC